MAPVETLVQSSSPMVASDRSSSPLDEVFACLAHRDRRRVLGILQKRAPDRLSPRSLAAALVPSDEEERSVEMTTDHLRRMQAELHHVQLPKLEAAGLIDHQDDGIALADHPAYDDDGFIAVIGGAEQADADSLDALFEALAVGRRRTIMDVLSHQFGPVHVETLARELGSKELDVPESEVPADYVEDRRVSLRHLDLPRLSDAGLIEYDADERTVDYRGHPELRVPWMHSVLEPDFRASLTGESTPEELGAIQDREQVISFGQSLCDRADEELFCMFTDTGLLESGCLTRIRDAANERDTTVYLGTCDPTIREYVREHAPEVVLWEPKTNWLNLPVAGNNVGRLLLADREAVMLGTLSESGDDGRHGEKAIIGEGEDNPLVVMVTQLLQPYLDGIDEEGEALDAALPL